MEHTWSIVLVSFISLSILVQVLMWTMNVNPLKVVVLLGTFSLAMAFAGNDLVNFIGVAVAGLSSFQAWVGSGVSPDQFNMSILQGKVATPTWILLGSGLIMVITLWFNAKSRKVTETEVSLGRQDEGDEKFKPNFISRALVGSAVFLGNEIQKMMPPKWNEALSVRFDKVNIGQLPVETDKPSFDLIRASVNLLTASVVIAYGTSQKLPLSTTFVTFMVAMGTSFADQAWGRESAVYRVAGVINVIAGWLVTALVALTMSGIFAFILYKTGMTGMLTLTGLAAFFLIRSHLVFKKKIKEEESGESKVFSGDKVVNMQEAIDESKINTTKNLKTVKNISLLSIKSLISEDREVLRKSKKQIAKLSNQNEKLQSKIIKYIRKMDKGNLPAGRLYLLVFDLVQDLYQSALLLSAVCEEHVINHHPTPNRKYVKVLSDVDHELGSFIDHVVNSIEKLNFQNFASIEQSKNKLMDMINSKLDDQVMDIQNDQLGNRMGMLQTKLLLETKDIVAVVHRIYLLYFDFAKSK
ncbi:MAG: inorganic phosphate transporter [Flammeovirgaceae bacterium]|nr:inorganic phosphate transporter [Flammeovirgaceae bacterium]